MVNQLRISVIVLGALTVLTGVLYPLAVTGIAQLAFPEQANGSLIRKDKSVVGSILIGQSFSDPKYFWGRLSATTPIPYNASASTGSNFGVLNSALAEASAKRSADLQSADPQNHLPIPADLLTSSGSGLDPHISVAGAIYQIPRIARIRHMTEPDVRALVDGHTEGRQFGILGEPRVNVLLLNLSLDAQQQSQGKD